MYKDLNNKNIKNFENQKSFLNFKIIYRINWGSVINQSSFHRVKRDRWI